MQSVHGETVMPVVRSAILDDGRIYRYWLGRTWNGRPDMGFVLLNPSTADDRVDDPTTTWCMEYARNMGYGGVILGNLYAVRSSDPLTLVKFADPYGPENLPWLAHMHAVCETLFVGWGNGCTYGIGRDTYAREVAAMLAPVYSLGVTAAGHPMHPMAFARSGTRPVVQPFTYAEEPT